MIKYILTMAISFLLANGINANHAQIKIKHADKVIVKMGDHGKAHKMMKCLLMLKKHKTKEAAFTTVMAKIDERCKAHEIDDKKCDHIKAKVAKGIAKCFTAREFVHEFMDKMGHDDHAEAAHEEKK